MRRSTLPLLAVVLSTACGLPAPGEETDPAKLDQLNQELAFNSLESAMKNRAHFAPLCDAFGYPLVGNVVSKAPPQTTAAEFCTAIRKP